METRQSARTSSVSHRALRLGFIRRMTIGKNSEIRISYTSDQTGGLINSAWMFGATRVKHRANCPHGMGPCQNAENHSERPYVRPGLNKQLRSNNARPIEARNARS